MAEILVEENFVRIDGSDMNVLLNILDRIGLQAEPTAPRSNDTGRGWELAVHWLQAGTVGGEVAAALPGALAEIHDHFVAAGKIPPARVVLYGRNVDVLHVYEPDVETA